MDEKWEGKNLAVSIIRKMISDIDENKVFTISDKFSVLYYIALFLQDYIDDLGDGETDEDWEALKTEIDRGVEHYW